MSRVSTTEQNFKRLAMGRIDAFAEEKSVGYHILAGQLPTIKNAIVHHPRPLLINKSFVMFPKNNPLSEQRLEIFNQQLLKFKQSGRYQAYFDALDNGAYQPTNSALAD